MQDKDETQTGDTSDGARYKCPITNEYFRNPVHASDGHVYDHDALLRWFSHGENAQRNTVKSPRTGMPMTKHIFRSFEYVADYRDWCRRTGNHLPVDTSAYGLISCTCTPNVPPTPIITSVLPYMEFRLICDTLHPHFMLRATNPLIVAHFRSPIQDLIVRLQSFPIMFLKDLYKANVSLRRIDRTHAWYASFLAYVIKTHSDAGRTTLLDTRAVRYTLRVAHGDTIKLLHLMLHPSTASEIYSTEPTTVYSMVMNASLMSLYAIVRENGIVWETHHPVVSLDYKQKLIPLLDVMCCM